MYCTASPTSGVTTKTAPRRAAPRGWLATPLAVAVATAAIFIAVAVATPAEAAAAASWKVPPAAVAAAADHAAVKTLLTPTVRVDNYARCGSRYDSCTRAVWCHDNPTSGCDYDARAIADICCSCYRPCKSSGRRTYKERCRTRALRFGYTC